MEKVQPVALVTGGAKRVGRAIVERLCREGYRVAFTYLTSEREASQLEQAIGGKRIRADLTKPEEASQQIFDAFTSFSPRLDLLVNNASLYEAATLEQTDLTRSRRLMAIHYESPLLLGKLFASTLRQARGHVVNMLDLLAERPWPQYMAYCASKAALWNLTLSLARELAPDVTVNGIAPGVVEWAEDYSKSDREKYLKRVPLARAGTPEDVAEAVMYFANGGSYVTGQILRLDGGRSIT